MQNGDRTVRIFGVDLVASKRTALTQRFRDQLRAGTRGWVSYVNVHAMNLAHDLPWFETFLKDSIFTYCDGEGVRLAARLLGRRIPERIVFSDWIVDVCRTATLERAGVFILGGTEEVAAAAAHELRRRIPEVALVGYHHGFLDSVTQATVLDRINASGARILIVCMGMPLQERWILDNLPRLSVSLVLNGGSALDYVAGMKKRCPPWMGAIGMEWVYRLLQEPGRLWKRYLLGNPRFIIRVLLSRLNA